MERTKRSPGDRAERADEAGIGGEPVPRHLVGVHDVRQAPKYRVGEPVAGHHQSMAVVPTGTIEDHHGMGISGDLAADLAEMVVHRGGIADRHDQRRRFALRRADRTKQIGRSETEILRRHWPAAGLPPHPGQAVLLTDASLVLKPYLDSRTGRLRRPDSL